MIIHKGDTIDVLGMLGPVNRRVRSIRRGGDVVQVDLEDENGLYDGTYSKQQIENMIEDASKYNLKEVDSVNLDVDDNHDCHMSPEDGCNHPSHAQK